MMKAKILTLIAIFSIGSLFAQNNQVPGTKFGIIGGVNFQNLNGKDFNGNALENSLLLAYHGGVNVQIPVAPEFYLQPGLMLSVKGAKDTDLANQLQLSYLELPINFVYKALLGNGYFMLGFGPYLAYGIGGKGTWEAGSVNAGYDVEFEEATGTPGVLYLRPFDAGGNIFAGYELSGGLFFQFNTQLGMLNINWENEQNTADQTAIKNTGFGLSAGYRF